MAWNHPPAPVRSTASPWPLEDIWLDDRFGGALTPETVSESLYSQLPVTFWACRSLRAEDRLSAGPCPTGAPARLGVPPGTMMGACPASRIRCDGRIAEISTSWFDRPARYMSRAFHDAKGRLRMTRYGIIGSRHDGGRSISATSRCCRGAEVSALVEPDPQMAAATQVLVPRRRPIGPTSRACWQRQRHRRAV